MVMRSLSLALVWLLPASAVPQQELSLETPGTVNELMIGITFPSSEIVGEAAFVDPASPSDEDLFDPYSGWLKVETAAIAMAESANLLTLPGRLCSNGEVAPTNQQDWMGWVEDLRVSGMVAYSAAKAQSQEDLLGVAEQMSASCVDCHTRYLDVGGDPTNRCTP